MVLPALAVAGIMTAASLLAPHVSKWIAKKTLKKETQKKLEEEPIKRIIKKSEEETRKESKSLGFMKAYDLPGSQFYYKGKTAEKIKEKLTGLKTYHDVMKPLVDKTSFGFESIKTVVEKTPVKSKEDVEKVVKGYKKLETAEGIGEVIGTLGTSAASEMIGSSVFKSIAKGAGKSAAKTIGKVAISSGIGGAYEGAAQTYISGTARGHDVKTKDILIGAGIGATTASIFGSALAGIHQLSIKKPSVITKGTYRVSDWIGQSLIDPYEKPGDILAGVFEKGLKSSKFVKTPTIVTSSFTATPSTSTSTSSQTGTKSGGQSKRTLPIFSITPTTTSTMTPTPTTTSTSTPSTTPTGTPTPSATMTPTPTSTVTPTPMPTFTPEPAPTPTSITEPTPSKPEPTPTPTDTPTTTPTETPVPTTTPTVTPVPTSTVQPRMIPPLPMIPGAIPGEMHGYVQKGKFIYQNELDKIRRTMRDLFYM